MTVDPYAACDGARVLVVLTEWEELRWLDFDKVRELLARPCVVDARNVLDPSALRRLGFSVHGDRATVSRDRRHRRCGLPRVTSLRGSHKARRFCGVRRRSFFWEALQSGAARARRFVRADHLRREREARRRRAQSTP